MFRITRQRSSRASNRSGFTLVELLVVIGIISLLIAILLPTLVRARKTAYDTRSMSNLRQMLLGYTFYIQENRGAVPWGYPPAAVNGVPTQVDDPVTKYTFGWPLSSRYPWRLIKYCSNVWGIVHGHDVLPPLTLKTDDYAAAEVKAYTLSLSPTYGINSMYVGGDADRGEGFIGGQITPKMSCVFKATEVKHPTDLIVFADSQQSNSLNNGFQRLSPPRGNGVWWSIVNDKVKPTNPSLAIGLPIGWFTKRVVTGFFDGHVEAMLPKDLTDMRKWANKATSADYDWATAN